MRQKGLILVIYDNSYHRRGNAGVFAPAAGGTKPREFVGRVGIFSPAGTAKAGTGAPLDYVESPKQLFGVFFVVNQGVSRGHGKGVPDGKGFPPFGKGRFFGDKGRFNERPAANRGNFTKFRRRKRLFNKGAGNSPFQNGIGAVFFNKQGSPPEQKNPPRITAAHKNPLDLPSWILFHVHYFGYMPPLSITAD
jgi:hypothetical protein